jgi:hypothetical protein
MKFDRDMPITWQGIVLILALFAAFVSGGLFATSFSPLDHDPTVQAVSAIVLIVCLSAAAYCYRAIKAMPDVHVAPEVQAENRRQAEGRVAVYGPITLVVALLMTLANASNAKPGGTFLVPIGLIFVGIVATLLPLFRRRR